MKSNVIDQPAQANQDKLGMDAYADALTAFITDAQAPLTIALQGEWGSGKTSLMNTLRSGLVEEPGAPFLGVWINTWQYALMSDPAESIVKILTGIIGQITLAAATTEEERGHLCRKIAAFAGSSFSQFVAKQIGIDFKKNVEEWKSNDAPSADSGVESLKTELGTVIAKALEKAPGKRGYLFFIDDLDRIDPPVAVQILELLKNIFDLDRCIFVLAIDYGVVVKGLKPKFGEMTDENEREFRSFFDKIIQLPFSMPVANYKIDGFLMSSLADIGYLENAETGDKALCEALTAYALDSVGTNPRSLKRLINYLSLIRLLIGRTETKEDDDDLKNWKDVLFALVSLQIQYPKVYDALHAKPDFPNWGAEFEQEMRLSALAEGEAEKLKSMTEFDEPWEQMLFRFCRRDAFHESRALNVSRIMNRIKARIESSDKGGEKQPVGDTIEWLLRLSAITSVKSEPAAAAAPAEFSKSQYLKDLRWHTLGMRWNEIREGNAANLSDKLGIHSGQTRVQTNLSFSLWTSPVEGMSDNQNFIVSSFFHIFHDGKSFQIRIQGEFWGRIPGDTEQSFHAIDFNSDAVKADLSKALDAFRNSWTCFGVKGNCDCHPGDHVGAGDIWFNATIPFRDHDELVSPAFSQKFRGSLAAMSNAFASLLSYRISVNN